MSAFFNTTFGPADLDILSTTLTEWIDVHRLRKDSPEAELAAAVMINLFREGNETPLALKSAMSRHKALADLSS